MKKESYSRRDFVRNTSIAASAFAIGTAGKVSANDKARVAFIGTGGRGRTLMRFVTRIEEYELVSLCDKRQDRLDRALEEAKSEGATPKQYTDFQKMLDVEKLDGVIVATEVGNHAEVVVPVLEQGFNCFSEKPMECTVEKVDAITKAARKSKGIYQVGFQRRYNPTFLTTIKTAQSDEFGKITFLQGHWYFSGGVGGWVLDVEMSGGKLVEQSCHHMDVFSWVMGNKAPVTCSAMGCITVPQPDRKLNHYAEDHSSLNFQWEDGTILSYTHFSYIPEPLTGEKLWVFKDEAVIDLAQGLTYKIGRNVKEEPKQIAKPTDFYEGTHEELKEFITHIEKGETPLSNVETARVSTLTALMGHKAMYNFSKKKYEPSMVTWKDMGTTTDLA